MSNSVKIKLSTIHDPSEIYIKFLEGEKSKNNDKLRRRINNFQDDIHELAKTSERIVRPKFGEIYGCYIETWDKWVRGRVIYKQNSNYFKIFLVDHGHYNTKVSQVITIPKNMTEISTDVHYKASLGLKPVNSNKWCDETIKVCKEINKKSDKMDIRFVPLYEEQNIFIGDLFVFDGDEHYSLSEKFITLKLAEKLNVDFKTIFNTMRGKNIGPIRCVQPKKRLEIGSNQNISDIPKGITLHGDNLKAAFSSIDDMDNINNSLKKAFSIRNEKLSDVQSLMWPQLCDTKHAVIISNKNECLTSTYLLPLINRINKFQNYRKNHESLGCDAIIFAKNSTRVEEIAKRCSELAKDLQIIKAVGMCNQKKMDLINGCDILITTLPAFMRLIENIAVKIIDENRLKWIVFDDFDQYTIQKFEKEIGTIMRARYKASKIPQTVVASKNVISSIKKRILSHLPQKDTVFFMDSYLDAAAFVGLSISIEIASKKDEKIEKLIGFENHEKSIIVANDNETAVKLEEELSKLGLKALNCDNIDIAKLWDESSTNNCILIITDDILNNSNIQNANNLIHFDLPLDICKGDKFLIRFKTFSSAVEKLLKSPDEATTLKTRIIFSDENVDQFEELVNLLVARNLMRPNEKVFEKINDKNEAIKRMNNVPICTILLQYGTCKKFSCPNRHVLTEDIKSLSRFIKFDIITVQDPTTFAIRIREYYDNNEWISNDQAKEMIEKDLQNYCMQSADMLSSKEGKLGEIYAKYDSKMGQWVRGKMVKRSSNEIVVLNLIDHVMLPQDIPALEKTLLKLPNEYTTLNPLISKMQVMNLVPLDGESSYSSSDINKLLELMNKIPKDAVYVAKVEAMIGDVIFVKNIEAKNIKNYVVFRLKAAHLKIGISEIDESFGAEIMKLAGKSQRPEKEEEVKCIKNVQDNSEKGNYWKQLKYNESYAVSIKHFISPYSFFVVLENPENLTLKNALKNIEESQDHQLLVNPNVNDCCLLDKNDRKLRAKILKIDENEYVEVLLVDYGEVLTCCKEKIYKIPDDFLNYQFQAIHCSMLAVRPKFNMNFWPSLQKSAIRRLLMEYSGMSLKMKAIKKDQKKNNFSEIGINCYEVLLYVNETYLHEIAVKRGIASGCDECYEKTVDESDHDSVIESSSSENTTSMDDEDYLSEELKKLLDICQESVEKEVSRYEREISSSEFTNTSVSSSECTTQMSSNGNLFKLKSMFKQPYIEWRQNEALIYMVVSAKDCCAYSLKVTESSMDVIISYADNNLQRTIIQLYGSVRPEFSSHELAGINIIIRLPKKRNSIKWPRLTMSNDKSHYIKYSSEKMPYFEMKFDVNECSGEFMPPMDTDEDSNIDFIDEFKNSSSDEEFF